MNEPYTKEELAFLAGTVMVDIRGDWNNYNWRLDTVIDYLTELRDRFDDQDAKQDLKEIEEFEYPFDGRYLCICYYYGWQKSAAGITPRVLEELERVCEYFDEYKKDGYFDRD